MSLLRATEYGGLLQALEQVKRLVWLIEKGHASMIIDRNAEQVTATVVFSDGMAIVGKGTTVGEALHKLFDASTLQAKIVSNSVNISG